MIEFTKMHGLGNDFVVIDAISQSIDLSTQQVQCICERHFGVGCDQLLLVEETSRPGVDFRYRIFNADGLEVEQCGNGARCFAHFVRESGMTDKTEIRVETASGEIVLRLESSGEVSVDMGVPIFEPEKLPFLADSRARSYDIVVNDEKYAIGAVSVGNPHAVLRVDNIKSAPLESLGAALESHERFPQRVNVGFMEVKDRENIELRVFERGVGETLACGSGACAAVAVGAVSGWLDARVNVHLRGGTLAINWPGEGDSMLMTGPAQTVYQGRIDL